MELSPYAQGGWRVLGDPRRFPRRPFAALLRAAFRSLLEDPQAALDDPDLKDIDPTVLKHCHAAAATCILEAGKQKADISAISTCLEDCKLDKERIEQFCTEYQKNKDALEILLGSIGRSPLHITDVSWRLEYQIKNNQLHKTYQPSYLVTLNVENSDSGSHPDVSFSCTMEQLQVLVSFIILCLAPVVDVGVFSNLPIKIKSYILLFKKKKSLLGEYERIFHKNYLSVFYCLFK
ncbi:COMM domain-containing protein 3 isoform X1 [Manacus candei]|uniref:COMM domain-containing protein 3 isoform X1 n=1 Tax=Manacus candei TaxID=415023 RepID=UPI002227A959|nr:COMM domain-containing protein 3 isoform X1 [Manacus candei]